MVIDPTRSGLIRTVYPAEAPRPFGTLPHAELLLPERTPPSNWDPPPLFAFPLEVKVSFPFYPPFFFSLHALLSIR